MAQIKVSLRQFIIMVFTAVLVLNACAGWAQGPSSGSASLPVVSISQNGNSEDIKPLNKEGTDINDNAVIDVLQLKDMNIMDVFKVISEKTGLNIIAGQGIAGQVTIYLKNVKLKDVLRIILEANNLAYSVQDGVIHVMPAQEFERRFGRVFGGDIRTKIRKLVHTDVSEMLTLLNQIKSSTGKVISDPRSNTLVLMDSPDQIKFMEKLIDEVDVPVTTKVFELSYAKAKDVAEKLDAALLSKSGSVKFD